MALVGCPECGQAVSDQAAACPHCGYSINPGNDPAVRDRRFWRLVRFLSGLFFLLVIIILAVAATMSH